MRPPPLLFRYLFGEVARATLWAFLVLVSILFYGNAVRNDEYFLQALFLSPETFFTLMGLLAPYAASYALPLGFVVGLLLALGRLSADKEILAMRTLGLGMGAIVAPVLLLASAFSVLGVCMGVEWAPRSRAAFEHSKAEIVLNSLDLFLRRDGSLTFELPPAEGRDAEESGDAAPDGSAFRSLFASSATRCVLSAGEIDGENWKDLRLGFHDDKGDLVAVLFAREGIARRKVDQAALALELRRIDVEGTAPRTGSPRERSPGYLYLESTDAIELPLQDPSPPASIKRMGFRDLLAHARHAPEPEQRTEAKALLHKNLALGCSPLCLGILALPLSIRVGRRETMVNAALALLLALLYFFLLTFLPQTLRDRTPFPIETWSWAPGLFAVCAGAVLTLKANTPSRA